MTQLTSEQRLRLQSIPVIVVTAKEITAEDRRRLNSSVQGVPPKGTLSREGLLREIRAVLQLSRTRAPGIATKA